jgi:hypothetical protein
MIKYVIPLLLVAAAILLIAWLFYRWIGRGQESPSRPRTLALYVLCTGCVAAGLLALALF